MWTLFTFDCVISAADFRSGGKSNPTLGFQPAAPTCVQPPRPPPPPPPQRACFPVLSPPSLMGRPLAGSELRGAFISDPQVRPRCLSCQNSPIQHCAEFINAALTHTHTHYHTWAHTHTLREMHAHRCTLQKMLTVRLLFFRTISVAFWASSVSFLDLWRFFIRLHWNETWKRRNKKQKHTSIMSEMHYDHNYNVFNTPIVM